MSEGTIDRIKRDEGLSGALRGKDHQTTTTTTAIATATATATAKDGKLAGDLVNRDFATPCPTRVWVTDFTYCQT